MSVGEVFRREVPEIALGVVEVKCIARRAGVRTKVAVMSHDPDVDAIGACVGPGGTRVKRIGSALGGEPIDIVTWSSSSERMVRAALAPIRVVNVELNLEQRRAVAHVRRSDLEAAASFRDVDRELASRLSGWEIELAIL